MIISLRQLSPQIVVPANAHSLVGFREWIASETLPEEVTAHLIEGEIFIEMSPERIETHVLVKQEVNFVLTSIIKRGKLGVIYPDGLWLTNDAASLSTEPDACFATYESHRTGRVVRTSPHGEDRDEIELRGSPEWVLEVVSPYSEKKDLRRLPIAYFKAGVSEYWLVDARDEEIEFTIFVRGKKGFTPAKQVRGWIASPVFGKKFRLERIDHPIVGCEYELRVR